MATDSIFLTSAVDAFQERDVAFLGLLGAFIHTLTDKMIIMTVQGELHKLMSLINPNLYRKHIYKDKKGNPVLYLELYKSIYGLMQSALLFYKNSRASLKTME